MEKKNYVGLPALLKKAMAIISASTASLLNHSQAATHTPPESDSKNFNIENFKERGLRSKLVLKLNTSNAMEGRIVMHTSHRSHSSHSSHSSHYSSSSSYTPSSIPKYTPSAPKSSNSNGSQSKSDNSSHLIPYTPLRLNNGVDKSTNIKNDDQLSITSALSSYTLGSRILFKGCRGTDVKALQDLLNDIGYDITVNGYFGETTKTAVIDFQTSNSLKADGRVGPTTLAAIQNK